MYKNTHTVFYRSNFNQCIITYGQSVREGVDLKMCCGDVSSWLKYSVFLAVGRIIMKSGRIIFKCGRINLISARIIQKVVE